MTSVGLGNDVLSFFLSCLYLPTFMKKILYLPIKRKWFDLILKEKKKEECREYKPYWISRLENKHYDEILFRNGYSKSSRMIRTECLGISTTTESTVLNTDKVFIIKIGKIIK